MIHLLEVEGGRNRTAVSSTAQVHALRPDVFPKWKDFAARYCEPKKVWRGRFASMDYRGASNLGEVLAPPHNMDYPPTGWP